MTRTPPWLSSLVHYIAAPGVVIGLLPWLLTGWQPESPAWPPTVRVLAALMIAVGVAIVTAEFVRFVREGDGSPAPVAPTRRLVTGGLYRYIRNPMYVGVVAAIVGQGLLLSSPVLLIYGAFIALIVSMFVHWYEEPTLRSTYGSDYDDYCRRVPRWIPVMPRAQRRKSAE